MFDKIRMPNSNMIIPSVYDDAKSYYEQIAHLMGYINVLIDYVNGLEATNKTYTDQEIALLKTLLETQINSVYQYASTINVNLTNLIGVTANQLTASYTQLINNNVSGLNERITLEVSTLNARITTEVQALRDYIASQLIELKVINPLTGELSPVQDVLNALADLHRTDALTAGEYDALGLTASAYDAFEITAYDYDFQGKILLGGI